MLGLFLTILQLISWARSLTEPRDQCFYQTPWPASPQNLPVSASQGLELQTNIYWLFTRILEIWTQDPICYRLRRLPSSPCSCIFRMSSPMALDLVCSWRLTWNSLFSCLCLPRVGITQDTATSRFWFLKTHIFGFDIGSHSVCETSLKLLVLWLSLPRSVIPGTHHHTQLPCSEHT